jgi:hypothetical protein
MDQIKNYIGFSLDFSLSMNQITEAARRDYNSNIATVKEEAIAQSQDTIVSVVKCGVGRPAKNEFMLQNASVTALKPLDDYKASGSATPLFDSVNLLIEQFKAMPDANKETVSFLIMVTTDGGDNASHISGDALGREIKRLQATDRWTFVFRVPRGYKRQLESYGIPGSNILEWDQTTRGVEVATKATTSAMSNYYSARSAGLKSTSTFYTDLSDVKTKDVKAVLTDISGEVDIFKVLAAEDGEQIQPFVERRTGKPYVKGAAFYELTKTERRVQDYKKIVIKDKKSAVVYGGAAARDLLGLPQTGDVRLVPSDHKEKFVIFIQSTSTNRKLFQGSSVLYWPNAV